jgi:hypothetical protein
LGWSHWNGRTRGRWEQGRWCWPSALSPCPPPRPLRRRPCMCRRLVSTAALARRRVPAQPSATPLPRPPPAPPPRLGAVRRGSWDSERPVSADLPLGDAPGAAGQRGQPVRHASRAGWIGQRPDRGITFLVVLGHTFVLPQVLLPRGDYEPLQNPVFLGAVRQRRQELAPVRRRANLASSSATAARLRGRLPRGIQLSPAPGPAARPHRLAATAASALAFSCPCKSRRQGSRRLYAGHRLASTRAPSKLIPGAVLPPGSDATFSFTTPQRRRLSPGALERLPGPHLTYQVRLSFPVAHHDGLQPTQHRVVWHQPPQADAGRPTIFHLLHSTASERCLHRGLFTDGHVYPKLI